MHKLAGLTAPEIPHELQIFRTILIAHGPGKSLHLITLSLLEWAPVSVGVPEPLLATTLALLPA